MTEEGIKFLAVKKNIVSLKEANKAVVLRLRVISGAGETAATCKIGGYLAGELVVEAEDPACGELKGETTALAAGRDEQRRRRGRRLRRDRRPTPVRF